MRLRSRDVRAAVAALLGSLLLVTAACGSDDGEPQGSGPELAVTAGPTDSAAPDGGDSDGKGKGKKGKGKKGEDGEVLEIDKPYVPGNQDATCPDDHPVKFVNQTGVGKVYATPGGDGYDKIRPGFCFRDVESAAMQPGYREFKGEWPLG